MPNHQSNRPYFRPDQIFGCNANYDRNFDDLAEKFCRNIYGSTKGKLRQIIVNEDLDNWLNSTTIAQKGQLNIIEAGGGDGRLAIEWAQKGHKVTFCDLSHEMVKRAESLAKSEQVDHLVTCIHAPAQLLSKYITQKADIIICHAVLEWVADQPSFLRALCNCLAEDGTLSLMFYNADAAFFRNTIMGNLKALVKGEVKRVDNSLVPMYPLSPPVVYDLIESLGLSIKTKTGVRVFHDYLHDPKLKINEFEALLALEQRYCREFPFVHLGRYIHVLASRESSVRHDI
ncbi:methyltransferase domain-containing protein [Thorsellia anophelis]|uniref:tRNA 5-carboxymethoxyuridine methyltransferase n=1 Tax=Thorsellia anophelis DSM 18579 TaxID=1123402 RepID=A0A1H9ZA77_9GAMM|nr:methyltransferase domain-containing protein [Thorsellia anophelis]SES78515.1 S-adenosylmethionine-dependent methyltransferase [Thorsellia anophelis DSM 18579]